MAEPHVALELGSDDDPESLSSALQIGAMGTPFSDYQGTLYMNPRYKADEYRDAEFRDYGLARAVRIILNNAAAIQSALASLPQQTAEPVALRDAAIEVDRWLRGALEYKDWLWGGGQRFAAETARANLAKALAHPASPPVGGAPEVIAWCWRFPPGDWHYASEKPEFAPYDADRVQGPFPLALASSERSGREAVIEECAKVAFERAHDNHKKANAYGANGDDASQLSCMTAAVEAMEIAAAIRNLAGTKTNGK